MVNNSKNFLLEPLHGKMPIVDAEGNPTPYFQHIMQLVQLGVTLTKGPGGEINVADGEITLEMLQEIQAKTVLGLNDTVNGPVEEVTTSQLLDWLGTAAQGDIIYRGASGWALLHAGTAGQLLSTGGAGANPSWVSGVAGGGLTLIESKTFTGSLSTYTFASIPGTYKDLILSFNGRSDRAANVLSNVAIRFNGDTTAANYYTQFINAANATVNANASAGTVGYMLSSDLPAATAPAGYAAGLDVVVHRYAGTTFHKMVNGDLTYAQAASAAGHTKKQLGGHWLNTAAITSLTLFDINSANLTNGSTAELYGRS